MENDPKGKKNIILEAQPFSSEAWFLEYEYA